MVNIVNINGNTISVSNGYLTTSLPLEVGGVIKHTGVILNEKTVSTSTSQITSLEIDEVITINANVNLVNGDSNGWVSFLYGNNFFVGGSYIIHVFIDDRDAGTNGPWHYNYIYSGIMSWSPYINTNDADSSQEIPLHSYGHARTGGSIPGIKLRTLSRSGNLPLELQIADQQGDKPDNPFQFTVKMRRMI
jgi:hypothetical protein